MFITEMNVPSTPRLFLIPVSILPASAPVLDPIFESHHSELSLDEGRAAVKTKERVFTRTPRSPQQRCGDLHSQVM